MGEMQQEGGLYVYDHCVALTDLCRRQSKATQSDFRRKKDNASQARHPTNKKDEVDDDDGCDGHKV